MAKMRRWNGWGFSEIHYPLNGKMLRLLKERLGKAEPLPEVSLEEAIAKVPQSRLPEHPLVITDAETRLRHACGQSVPDWIAMRSGNFPAYPDGVAFPETNGQVRELLEWARTNQVIIIPYGGGTSVAGQVTAYPTDLPLLSLSLERMNGLIDFDKVSRLARFGAGITGLELEARLLPLGYMLGHYPQSFELSTLGGWIATRSTGQQSMYYGRIEKLFAGGRVETFAGTLELPSFPASAAGPDLKEMILGSEGRFGIITEAVVRVVPLPEVEEIYGCFFPSWNSGIEAVRELVQAGFPLSILRLSNAKETEIQLKLTGHPILIWGLNNWLSWNEVYEGKCLLLMGFTGIKAEVESAKVQAFEIVQNHHGVNAGQSIGGKMEEEPLSPALFAREFMASGLCGGYFGDGLQLAPGGCDGFGSGSCA